MWAKLKELYSADGSYTIWSARIFMVIGSVWSVLITTDLSPWLTNPKVLTAWIVFQGIVTEIARRRTLS